MLSQISIQQITGLVDKLEKRGLMECQPDRKDRRVKRIAVAPAGAKFQMLDSPCEPPASVISLTQAQKKACHRIFRRTVDAAERDRKEPRCSGHRDFQ
jgi:hypothetical protein